MKSITLLLLTSLLLGWIGCSSPQEQGQESSQSQVEAPPPGAGADVAITQSIPTGNQKVQEIETALNAYFNKELDQLTLEDTRYAFSKLDLNNNGKGEMLVYLPGTHFCEGMLCTLLVLQQDANGVFVVVSRISSVQPPVLVSNETSNGWKDLIVNVTPDQGPFDYRVLPFDGKSYASNPLQNPARSLETLREVEEHLSTAQEADISFLK